MTWIVLEMLLKWSVFELNCLCNVLYVNSTRIVCMYRPIIVPNVHQTNVGDSFSWRLNAME